MRNLENNKIYNLSRISIIVIVAMSTFVSLIRLISPTLAEKLKFLGLYSAWFSADGVSSAIASGSPVIDAVKMAVYWLIIIVAFIVLYWLSGKSHLFLIASGILYAIDSIVFVYLDGKFVSVLAVRVILIAVMAIGVYYALIGYKIEAYRGGENGGGTPDIKFVSKSYSSELAEKQRVITFVRSKSFFASHIYLQIFVDNNNVCYLKDGEEKSLTIDANAHSLTIVCHYSNAKNVKVKIPQGELDKSYRLAVEFKNLISREIKIYDNN